MKVAVIGATGYVGTQVVNELVFRGYDVIALARKFDSEKDGVLNKVVDVYNEEDLVNALQGSDAVINTFNAGWTNPNLYDDFLNGSRNIEKAVEKAGIKRFITVGGAGSLYVDEKTQIVDTPDFPKEIFAGANAARNYLNELKENTVLDWTFFSPAIEMSPASPGERTGKYRVGTENPVFDSEGRSRLSVEDVAVVLVDELEKSQFVKQRFTAAY